MEVEAIDVGDRRARFLVRDVSAAFANGLRRAMVGDVPSMAIDTVDVYENNSVMFDEVLSLRLGLVPLTTDLDSYVLPDECSCEGEGCTNCEVALTLDVSAEDDERTAYSGDLESEDPAVEPVHDEVPLIELKPGQVVALECTARLGRGRDHAKNQAGVSVGYSHLKRVVEDGSYDERVLRGTVETADGDIVEMSEHDNLVDEAFDGDVGFEDVDDAFVFSVESDGSLPVEELVARAAESLEDRASELGDKVAV